MPAAKHPNRSGSRRLLMDRWCSYCFRKFRPRISTTEFCTVMCARRYHAPRMAANKRKIPRECAQCSGPTARQSKKFCSESCYHKWQVGRPMSPEAHINMSVAQQRMWSKKRQPGWRPHLKRLRMSPEARAWREAVFSRDDYTCDECRQRGGKLQADHIYPFAAYPDKRFDVDNGRTLCVECHQKTSTWGNRWKVDQGFQKAWHEARTAYGGKK